ncbi:MAG: DUF3263 domain-containing protein [Acidimicrobiaceae bacterium]|nr:DUF3263 domain-containing protein [Acidimicrobiaceae bacterium]MBO0748500.1 DUF3263 domain-containing protein [Acidimicrobiaceae bacterium]
MDLSDRDRAILDFERGWWVQPGSKEDAIKARLNLSATRYYELLGELVESAEAEQYDPLVVRRVRRARARRRQARTGRTAGRSSR